jgi:hypothetical protein
MYHASRVCIIKSDSIQLYGVAGNAFMTFLSSYVETGLYLLRSFILNMLHAARTKKPHVYITYNTDGHRPHSKCTRSVAFNLHVKLHGNFITMNLSTVSDSAGFTRSCVLHIKQVYGRNMFPRTG